MENNESQVSKLEEISIIGWEYTYRKERKQAVYVIEYIKNEHKT